MSSNADKDLVFDPDQLMLMVDGDEELLGSFVEIFLEDLPENLQAIREAIDQGNPDGVAAAAHNLKGALANFGAGRSRKLTIALQEAGRSGQLEEAGALLDELREEADRLTVELRALLVAKR